MTEDTTSIADTRRTETMTIQVNGEDHDCPAGSTVASLLADLDLDPRTVAIEHNGELARRVRFEEIPLAAGDRLEIVRFVQGG